MTGDVVDLFLDWLASFAFAFAFITYQRRSEPGQGVEEHLFSGTNL
jgi:hypothetical protein